MLQGICFCVVLYLTSLVLGQQNTPYCIINNSTNPNDPALPTLPDQYQTIIEANIVDKNFSLTTREYFDNPGNRAALSMEQNGILQMLIYDYQTNEIFDIAGLGCKVRDLQKSANAMLFGNVTIHGLPHVYSTGGALHFLKSFGEHYKGRTVVRGIQVDHWQSCLHWPFLQSVFTLDYFFTAKNWNDPISHPQIPVRAVATGQQNNSGVIHNFTHYYEYINFKTTIDDPTVFETPKGVVCRGRKKTQPVSQLPSFYHFKQQIIRTNLGNNILLEDVWYDYTYKLFRVDYKLPVARPPLNTTNAVTEIHDFNSGIRYFQDQVTKQCATRPLSNDTLDVGVINNGSYSLFMKDPMQLFRLNNSYAYTGQRTTRGILCDVYSMVRFDLQDYKGIPAILEYYFMADSLTGFPDDSAGRVKHVPVHLELNVPSKGYKESIDFIDFDEGHPSLDVFNILACYSENAKLQFTVKFKGQYKKQNHNKILNAARTSITKAMGVMPIRLQAPKLKYDNSFIYFSAMLLDRSPYEAQFTFRSHKEIEKQDDRIFPSAEVSSVSGCAQACVDYSNFTCNSFDYCGMDPSPCRISRAHISDGKSTLINSTCDHYSRTVNGPVYPEVPISAAYNSLATAVYQNQLQLSIEVQFQLDPDVYNATDVSVIFGRLYPQGVPKINDRFSYHSEITTPFTKSVVNAHIWYDYPYQLVRYDMFPTSTIHDFNAGLSYTTDMTTGQCVVSAVQSGAFDVHIPKSETTDSFDLQLKNPLQLFYISNSFKYVGQKTVRGMMCDVYEDTQPFTFMIDPQPSVFQMYFLTQDWHELSEGSGIPVGNQPIQLVISAADASTTTTYDFYDFSDEHPDLANFNIQPCFTGKGKYFLIKFNQTNPASLNSDLKTLQTLVQSQLAAKTGVSPLRFQNPQVTYSPQFTYYIGTMVEQAPFILDFTKVPNKVGVYSSDATYVSVADDQACARLCRRIAVSFTCQSFDYCPSTQLCQLSKTLVSDGSMLNQSLVCDHYFRTASSSAQVQPTVAEAFTILQDQIARNLFTITIQTKDLQNVTYPAILFNTNILRFDSEAIGSTTLSHFTRLKKTTMPGLDQHSIIGISVDDCATRCLTSVAYDCQAFHYCADIGVCTLSQVHPDDVKTTPSFHQMCDIFARRYIDSYIAYPGKFIQSYTTHVIGNGSSADLCAYQCNSDPTCKSFDYCKDKWCYFNTEHIVHIPPVLVASAMTCTHYSKNFLSDFRKSPKKSLTTSHSFTFENVSDIVCARLCIEHAGFSCQTFTYCSNIASCVITNISVSAAKYLLQPRDTCDFYTRQDFSYLPNYSTKAPLSTQPTTNPPNITIAQGNATKQNLTGYPPNINSDQGYSTGAMVGIAVGMMALGISLGAVIMFILQTKRFIRKKPSQFEMGVTNHMYNNMDNDHTNESSS